MTLIVNNNIIIEHHGIRMSIAQHRKDWVRNQSGFGKPFVQEIMILDGRLNDNIYEYDGTLTGLSSVLLRIEEDLNRRESK